MKLGFPNAIKVFMYNLDEYPGHSLECIRFAQKLMKNTKDKEVLEYTQEGTGIDINGYHVHIGDSREHVMDEFAYKYPEGNGTSYELGCYLCDTGYLLTFTLDYDANDILEKIRIQKYCYR